MKVGTIVILVVIVIGALVIGLMRTGVVGGDSAPREVLDRAMEVIDVETLETREVTVGEFEQKFRVDPDTGYRIDSDGRKVATPSTCMSCGEKIPPPPTPRDIEPEEHERIMREYECPKCGERAMDMGF